MSQPSNWPLPPQGIRYALAPNVLERLATHPLTSDLYPRVFGYYPNARGHRMERRHHDDWLLMYCAAGAGTLSLDGQRTFNIREGDLVLLPPGVPHRYQADRKQPWTIYWVHFLGRKAVEFQTLLGTTEQRPVVSVGLLPRLLSEFQGLMAPRLAGSRFPVYIHQALLLQELLGYCALHQSQPEKRRKASFNLEGLHAFMQQHIRDHLSLQELADFAGLSPHHFARRYKQLTGESPIQHFLQLKMQHACFLLEVSDDSVQSVAQELGYEDAYYFSRIFKRIVGKAPHHYRAARPREASGIPAGGPGAR